ncbi:uncharacterized protein FIBRA_08907 [Fibroporia radiculosa]|uniref:Uncharacterized protein n=1 Tax=Fibroporia radiculosa TaxID=599839 RepID=J4I3I1_9APHY|nr:uncharacterized protein FIBRA_08907 [Fibroporia radiculosa]CCM06627.1 predicted protein [Fibroporia radiculosa]
MTTKQAYGATDSAPVAPTSTVTGPNAPVHRRAVSSPSDVILYFLAIFIPPLAVFFKRGFAADFWINICLWILGWIPGILHAWYVYSLSSMWRHLDLRYRKVGNLPERGRDVIGMDHHFLSVPTVQ